MAVLVKAPILRTDLTIPIKTISKSTKKYPTLKTKAGYQQKIKRSGYKLLNWIDFDVIFLDHIDELNT
jgi:hypothetical protein